MPAIQNVERRGAVYYWRRTIRFQNGKSITIRLSLRTTDQSVARRRACAMTTQSEVLRMKLGQGGSSAELTMEQKFSVYRRGLERMRDQLDRNHVQYQQNEPEDAAYMIEGLIGIYEAMLGDFILHGLPPNAGTRAHVDERLADLSVEQRDAVIEFFEMQPGLRDVYLSKADEELAAIGAPRNEENIAIARKISFEGQLAATLEFRKRLTDPMSVWGQFESWRAGPPVAPAPMISPTTAPTEDVPEPWASMTPMEAAEQFILDKPRIDGDAKRKGRWTPKTKEQFRAAARLLQKSYGARPLRQIDRSDIALLNDHFSRLPPNHHKSPRHDPMSLEEICQETAGEIAMGKREESSKGLSIGTTNRHFQFLRELIGWFGTNVPGIAPIDWTDFLYEDKRDARDQREAYTEAEGRAFFAMPIWHGAKALNHRLEVGQEIWHDAGYWVPLIAWYTGARREEICQLTLLDIGEHDGIWYMSISDENGGKIKNTSSRREVPFAAELVRLGLPDYVNALRKAGEAMLFPELRLGSGKAEYGNVYYRNWWRKMAAKLDFLEPGQALHSFRHMVTTELKSKRVFVEERADLIGHKLTDETAGRYSKATRLANLKEVVDQIPTVTDQLTPAPIRLLPPQDRAPRAARVVTDGSPRRRAAAARAGSS